MTITRIDHTATGLSLLISQYADKPKIAALLTSYLDRVQTIEDGLLDVYSMVLNIDSAVGAQLDIVGTILNEPRAGAPDFIYRRKLKTKVLVIRSQGTVEDLIEIIRTYQNAFESDGETADGSLIYCVTSGFYDPLGSLDPTEGRQIELTIITEGTNSYANPITFDPKGNHDQLLKAKAQAELIQSVYSIVNIGESGLTHSALITQSNVSGSALSSQGFGSVYLTGSDGFPTTGGRLSHRRVGVSNFADSGLPVNLTAPTIAMSSWAVSESFTITSGSWTNLPDSFSYTLYKDGSAFAPYVTASFATVSGYELTTSDLSSSWYVVETANHVNGDQTATSNTIVGPGTLSAELWDSNAVGHWHFGNAVNDGSTYSRVYDNIGTADLISASFGPALTAVSGVAGGAFRTNSLEGMFAETENVYSQATEAVIVFSPGATIPGSKMNILGTLDGTAANTEFYQPGAGGYEIAAGATYTVTGTTPISGTLQAAFIRFNGGDTTLWVNDFRSGSNTDYGSAGTNDWAALTVGYTYAGDYPSGGGNEFLGTIYEVAIRNSISPGSAEDETARQRWAQYIEDKYGIDMTYE